MPPAAPRLTPEPGIVVDAPESVVGKFGDDDKLIFWNRHGDDTANGPLYAMAAVKAGFPDEAKTLAQAVKVLDRMDSIVSGQWMEGATSSGDYPNTTFIYTAISQSQLKSWFGQDAAKVLMPSSPPPDFRLEKNVYNIEAYTSTFSLVKIPSATITGRVDDSDMYWVKPSDGSEGLYRSTQKEVDAALSVVYGPSETEIGVLCMYFFGLYQAYCVWRGRVTHQAVPGECDTLTVTPGTPPADKRDSYPDSVCKGPGPPTCHRATRSPQRG